MSKSNTAPAAPQEKKLNAAQKIEALEGMAMRQSEQINILADEIDRLRELVVGVNKRLNASIQATDSLDSVQKIIMTDAHKELEGRVEYLVNQGVLERDDTLEINDQMFVVGRELDKDANVVNPRVQFAVNTVDNSLKNALIGKKAGEVVAYDENEPTMEVTEIYKIVSPKKKQNYEQPAQ